VYNGEKNIIIWTRRILYYNLSHYNNIVYIEDSLNKSAMRYGHRYKHLEILRNMSLNSHFNISILSTLPSIESMYLLHIGTYNWTKN
jgi:primosomal protein N'